MRRRGSGAVAAAVALVSALSSCGVPVEESETVLPGAGTVSSSVASPVTTTGPDTGGVSVGAVVYFIRDEGLVGRARVISSGPESPEDLLRLLVSGPVESETASGVRSGLTNRPDLVLGTQVDDESVIIDLAATFADLPGGEQLLVLGQITLTVLANIPVKSVRYLLGGVQVAVPDADGTPRTRPVVRGDYVSLLARG